MKRKILTLKACGRRKGYTYDGKRHDVIMFEAEIDGKRDGIYRYSAPVTLSEELSKLGEVAGGYDYGSEHYSNAMLNRTPIKISAEIYELYGYKWIHSPRIIGA